MNRRSRRFLARSMGSAMVLAMLAVILFLANYDAIEQWQYTRKLTSANAASRAAAVAYLRRHAADESLLHQVGEHLNAVSADRFDAAVASLATADLWTERFGPAWVRYLVERAEKEDVDQRMHIATTLGQMLWIRESNDPRIVPAIEILVNDPDSRVRMRAMQAAACVEDSTVAVRLLQRCMVDAEPAIRDHAKRLLDILVQGSLDLYKFHEPRPNEDTEAAIWDLLRAETASMDDVPIPQDNLFARLHAVRISRKSQPEDLLAVFSSPEPELRDLACTVARQRFTDEQCELLAIRLLEDFEDSRRMAGAILAGLTPGAQHNELILRWLKIRSEQPDAWLVREHAKLGLAMMGRSVEAFEPASLLLHEKMPRSTLVLALLAMGRLEGLDWLLNPWGEPGVGGTQDLATLLTSKQFAQVLDEEIDEFPWSPGVMDPHEAIVYTQLVRDWYLVHRPHLRMDGKLRRWKSFYDPAAALRAINEPRTQDEQEAPAP